MSGWSEHNRSVIRLGLKNFARGRAKEEVLRRMVNIAESMIDFIDRSFSSQSDRYPEFTANLHDATGVAVYDDGVTRKFLPARRAFEAQQDDLGDEEWGFEMLERAIGAGAAHFSKGLWLVLFSASSYADQVERTGSPKDRGAKFFTSLAEQVGLRISGEFGAAVVGSEGTIGFYLPI